MNAATFDTTFTVTLPGLIEAEAIRSRRALDEKIEPTDAGRAYVECFQAAEAVENCIESQEGRTTYGPLLEAAYARQNAAMNAFYALTGAPPCFAPDSDDCIKDAGRE